MIGDLPPLQWLVTFRAVMEAGNFAGAAHILGLTPSAISHQMRALETRLGRPLFLRRNRTVVPTEDAILYSASIGDSFARLVTATHRVAASPGVRRLPIHCSPSFATLWLQPRLHVFLQQHPAIDVSVFISHEPAKLTNDGIAVDIQYARPVPEHCTSIPLGNETILPMASPAFIAEHAISSPSDVERVPLIHSLRCVVSWEQWAARYAPASPLYPRGHQFDRAYFALACAVDGIGLVLESTLQAQDMLRSGALVAPFGDLGWPVVAHRIIYRREDQANPDVMAFVDWVTRNVSETDLGEEQRA